MLVKLTKSFFYSYQILQFREATKFKSGHSGYSLDQLFSTCWASSPGKRQFLKLLSRSNFFKVPQLCVLWTQKHQIDAKFAWNIVFLLIKPNNSGLFQGEISEYLILVIFQVPAVEKRWSQPCRHSPRDATEDLNMATPTWQLFRPISFNF